METRSSLNQILTRTGVGKENSKRAMDQKIPGSTVKRKRLLDITNTVSSSARSASSGSQFVENPNEIACGITKECIAQLMEENATLMKALGERNKIIELSSIEMQKLRFMLEKGKQQNQSLALDNSRMLAELTESKERVKVLQHELRCTSAILRSKNLQLNDKEKLVEELREKIRVEEEGLRIVDLMNAIRQSHLAGDNINEKLNNEQYRITTTEENSKHVELATGISLSHPVNNGKASIPDKQQILRSKPLGSTASSHQAEENFEGEPHKQMQAQEDLKSTTEEENPRHVEVASDAKQLSVVDSSTTCEPTTRKRMLRSQSLGSVATMAHQLEAKETTVRRRSSRRKSDNQTSGACESKDNLFEIPDVEILDCSVISEVPNEKALVQEEASSTLTHTAEAKKKDNTRKSRIFNNLTSGTHESKYNLFEIVDAEIPANLITSEMHERKPIQSESADTLAHQVEAKENDKRSSRPSRRRFDHLKSEPCASKDPYLIEDAVVVEKTSIPYHSDFSLKHQKGQARQEDQPNTSSQSQEQESRRTSVGRPMRKAAEKVNTYKEVPLNVKMRRPV